MAFGTSSWLDEDPYAQQQADPWAAPAPTPAPSQASAPTNTPAPAPDWNAQPPGFDPTPAPPPSYTNDVGGGGQPPAATPGASGDWNTTYDTHLGNIGNATDPASKAIAKDALARQLQADLEADGHKVSWKGETLVVDGRDYEIPTDGGSLTIPPGFTGGITGYDPATGKTYGAPTMPGQGGGAASALWSQSGGDPQRFVASFISQKGLKGKQADAAALNQIVSALQSVGVNATIDPRNDGYHKGIMLNGQFVKMLDGYDNWIWLPGGDAPGNPAPAPPAGGGGGDWLSQFQSSLGSSAPAYTPNLIDENVDVPDFSSLYKMASADSQAETSTDALVRNILEHPDTMSERDVEMLRARNAEEAAVSAQQADESLQHFGFGNGLDTSPWLASQRADNEWKRRAATIDSNRTVDIAAADRRSSDRASAASIGQSWSNVKSAKQLATLNFAVESALQVATEKRNRRSLNESLRQAATELGLRKDDLVLSYIKTNMGYDVDLKKLQQAGDQFQADLLQRIAQLRQQDEQFQAQYGLDAQRLQHTIDQDYWERAKQTNAPA